MRRFVRKEKDKAMDWLASELITINHESTIISYKEALKMPLSDFLYIVRSRRKHNQMLNEKMTEIRYGK